MFRRIFTILLVVLLAVLLTPTLALSSTGEEDCCPGAFEVRDGEIYDARGRIAYFRGVNIAGNAKGTLEPDRPADVPFEPGELSPAGISWWDHLEGWGFNLARFCVFWEAIEPERGVYDETYLDKVETLLEEAASRGIYVVVDMHQDIFSRWFHGDGAPRWVVEETGVDPDDNNSFGGRFWGLATELSSDVRHSVTYFWNSEDLKEHFKNAWLKVAERVADNPYVLGYDIYNEPSNGDIDNSTGEFENDYLKPLYEDVIRGIEEVDGDAMFFVEPNHLDMYWSKLTPFSPDLDRLVYAPHIYDPISNMVRIRLLPSKLIFNLFHSLERNKAEELGMPMMVLEFGAPWTMKPEGTRDDMVDKCYQVLESGFTSNAMWDYSVKDVDVWNEEDFSLIDQEGNPRGLEETARPYVRRLKGTPVEQTFDKDKKEYVLEFKGGSLLTPTIIHVPKSVQYAGGFQVQVSDGCYSYQPETGELTYRCLPRLLRKHRLVITPAL